tara:strand:+ start:176 stop:553 length:378 start_codon:yes stop_codon:yes gene_type:complete
MLTAIFGLIFCFLCLWASRQEHHEGNTLFGDFAWLITSLFGYVGYFIGGWLMWFVFEDDLYPFFPVGFLVILITGGWAAGWFTDSDYKKMKRKEALEEARRPHETTIVDYIVWVLIALAVWYFFF